MTTRQYEPKDYFDLPHHFSRQNQSHESISPMTLRPATPPVPRQKLARSPLDRTSGLSPSDGTLLGKRTRVQTIEEGMLTHYATPVRQQKEHELGDSIRGIAEPPVIPRVSASSDKSFHSGRSRSKHMSHSTGSSSNASPRSLKRPRPARHRSSPSWTKVFTRGSTPKSERRASLSFCNVHRMSDSVWAIHSSTQPLRPPSIATRRSLPVSIHPIKIEKAFNDPTFNDPAENTFNPSTAISPKRRVSSTVPKQFISASITALRKLRNPFNHETDLTSLATHETQKIGSPVAKDHQTNLRKQHTGLFLNRVSSVLQDVKKLDLVGKGRFDRTVTAGRSKQTDGPRGLGNGSPAILDRVKSMEMEMKLDEAASQTSSLIDLTRGHTPNNTPEEQAKYIVFNHEGQPEEFLKIDISIRGQTSYLPSEARRIHTPPLPSDGLDGKRRGFFFDHTSPPEIMAQVVMQVQEHSSLIAAGQHEGGNCTSWKRAPTASKRVCPKLGKKGAKVKTGDWYATQLAEFDTVSAENSGETSARHLSMEKALTCWFDVEQKRIEDEDRLDHSIPEHLPTSPLCPRHPKYWRIVKKKGSQFRGCWMHGFGEFDEAEKRRYSIVLKAKA